MLKTALIVLATLTVVAALAAVDVPLQKLQPAALSGFEAKPTTTGGAVSFAFKKTGEERRLLAVAGAPAGDATGAMAAEITYDLTLARGDAPRLAVIAWDQDGGSWYKVSARPAAVGAGQSARVSIAGLTPTAFSTDRSGQLEWANVDRVWAGFIFDVNWDYPYLSGAAIMFVGFLIGLAWIRHTGQPRAEAEF